MLEGQLCLRCECTTLLGDLGRGGRIDGIAHEGAPSISPRLRLSPRKSGAGRTYLYGLAHGVRSALRDAARALRQLPIPRGGAFPQTLLHWTTQEGRTMSTSTENRQRPIEQCTPAETPHVADLFAGGPGPRLFGVGSYLTGDPPAEGDDAPQHSNPRRGEGRFGDVGGCGSTELLGEKGPVRPDSQQHDGALPRRSSWDP